MDRIEEIKERLSRVFPVSSEPVVTRWLRADGEWYDDPDHPNSRIPSDIQYLIGEVEFLRLALEWYKSEGCRLDCDCFDDVELCNCGWGHAVKALNHNQEVES